MEKVIDRKRSIGSAAKELGLETHIIRFWESKFSQIKPQIGKGERRYYFDKEMAVLAKIKSLLHDEGYSIAGLQKLLKNRKNSGEQLDLKEQNVKFLLAENSTDNSPDKDLFSLDDFINPDTKLGSEVKNSVSQLITKIEENLKKLEQF